VVAVTHDRYFLDNVAGWILELDRGHGIPLRPRYGVFRCAAQGSPLTLSMVISLLLPDGCSLIDSYSPNPAYNLLADKLG
jgi:hypothetical protein